MKLLGNIQKSKVYRLFILSHVIVLLFPLVASPVMIAGARKMISSQMAAANAATLQTMAKSIDAMITDVYASSSQLLMHDRTLALKNKTSFLGSSLDTISDLKTRLAMNILQSEIISDIYLYFCASDSTLCRGGVYHSSRVADTIKENLHLSYEQWNAWKAFDGGRASHFYQYTDQNGRSQDVLLFYHKNNRHSTAANSVIAVSMVNLALLRETLGRFGGDSYAGLYILIDNAGVIGAANDEALPAPQQLEDCLTEPSAFSAFQYKLLPHVTAGSALKTMMPYIIIYYIVCFLIGLVLIVFLSPMHYTPLQQIAGDLLGAMDAKRGGNEYELIDDTIKHTLKRLRDSDRTIAEYQDAGRDGLLWHLFMGRVARDTPAQLARFGLAFPAERFCVVLFSVETIDLSVSLVDDERLPLDVIDFIVTSVAQAQGQSDTKRYAAALDDCVGCLVALPQTGSDEEVVEALYAQTVGSVGGLTARLHLTVNAAIGGPYLGLEGIHKAYAEAYELLSHNELLMQQKQVLLPRDAVQQPQETQDRVLTLERDRSVVDYVKQNYQDNALNLSAIALYFELTPSYISQIIRHQTGLSALDYIHQLRITKAKQMLDETSLSIKDVAQAVGYGSSLNMIRAFHRYEGVTPNEYRQRPRQASAAQSHEI